MNMACHVAFTNLQTVAMDIDLSHSTAPHVDVLYLFRGDVLALCQLKDMLLPINDLQRPILPDKHAHMLHVSANS